MLMSIVPPTRVMSPNDRFDYHRSPCKVCRFPLHGPQVGCSHCGELVHPQCVVAVIHEPYCETCFEELRAFEENRRTHRAAARGLGVLGARGSELVGTAVGAVGSASLAAGRYFVSGAVAGAASAWQGSRASAGLEVRVPRPDSLPPPLPEEPVLHPTAAAPSSASEGPGRSRSQEEREELRRTVKQQQEQIARLTAMFEQQNADYRRREEQLQTQLAEFAASRGAPSEVSANDGLDAIPKVDTVNMTAAATAASATIAEAIGRPVPADDTAANAGSTNDLSRLPQAKAAAAVAEAVFSPSSAAIEPWLGSQQRRTSGAGAQKTSARRRRGAR